MYKSVEVLGYNVFNGNLDDVNFKEKVLINTFSPNSYGIALKDKEFEIALKGTDILVLDGMGIALGSLLIKGKNIRKIAGQDCFDYLVMLANKKNWKIFFLGSSEDTLKKITTRLAKEFPNVVAGTYSPPFRDKFTKEDNLNIVHAINVFSPDVLFVGLTAPKQEKWSYQHRNMVNARIISTIGNVFDWYAGNSKRPSKFWIKLRLEWLIRIFLRPEIFRRNIKNQMKFFRDVLLHITYIKRLR